MNMYMYFYMYMYTHAHTHQHHITLQGVFNDYHFMAGSLYVMKVLEGGAAAESGLVLDNEILLTVSERVRKCPCVLCAKMCACVCIIHYTYIRIYIHIHILIYTHMW